MNLSRRAFAAGLALAASASAFRLSKAQAQGIGEPERFTDPATRAPLTAADLNGRTTFVTLNGGSRPSRATGSGSM
jgi:hypothetical protein